MMIMIKYNFQEVEPEAEPVDEATPQEESTDKKEVEESEESVG